MLDNKGFDLWAESYDDSVKISDENETYPFAGYHALLNEIYKRVLKSSPQKVLDVGFGTGLLTTALYEAGYEIYGQDFSEEMKNIAVSKMPKAHLFVGDFNDGLVGELMNQTYDVIVATYSLHHLKDDEKINFINSLHSLLSDQGVLYIGDVAFQTREALTECRLAAGKSWDYDEFYFVYDELKEQLPQLSFEPFSACAGLFTLRVKNF